MRSLLSTLTFATAITIGSTAAMATPVTHNLSATINGSGIVTLPLGGPLAAQAHFDPAMTWDAGFPFVLNDGDTIEIDFTVTGPGLTLTSSDPGFDEFLTVAGFDISLPFDLSTDNPGNLPVLHYDRSTTLTVNSFSGSYPGNPVVAATSSTFSNSPSVTMNARGNITDSSVTLFDFTISSTFTNFVFDPAFSAFDGPIELTDGSLFFGVDQLSAVPAPGAIALLGLGLIGVGVRRRVA